jgi:hypothetical protein
MEVQPMRRMLALGAALLLVTSLAPLGAAAGPPTANRMVGNFEILEGDGSLVGHIVVNYTVPNDRHWVPGTLDVTWEPGARFPYAQPPYGARQSHTVLAAAWFGPGDGDWIETGVTGAMCDFGAPWNATCHEFMMVIQDYPAGIPDLIAFGPPGWEDAQWYLAGDGAFALTYVAPTG